jgi:hypothetical protein
VLTPEASRTQPQDVIADAVSAVPAL